MNGVQSSEGQSVDTEHDQNIHWKTEKLKSEQWLKGETCWLSGEDEGTTEAQTSESSESISKDRGACVSAVQWVLTVLIRALLTELSQASEEKLNNRNCNSR